MDTCRDKTRRYLSPFTLAWAVAEVIWSNTPSVSQITAVVPIHLFCNVSSKPKGEFIKRKKNTYMSLSSFPTFWQALQVPAFMLHSKCVCVCVDIWALYKIYSLHTHWRSLFTLSITHSEEHNNSEKEPIQKRGGGEKSYPKSLGKLHTPCRYQEIPFSYDQRNSVIFLHCFALPRHTPLCSFSGGECKLLPFHWE